MVRRSIPPGAVFCALLVLVSICSAQHPAESRLAELKQRLSQSSTPDQPGIAIQIAHFQLGEANRLYADNDPDNARAALNDVALYCERAGNAAIESKSHEKQTEITVRQMIRRLTDMKRAAVQDDQVTIQSAIDRLEQVRDSLLEAMFPKHPKK